MQMVLAFIFILEMKAVAPATHFQKSRPAPNTSLKSKYSQEPFRQTGDTHSSSVDTYTAPDVASTGAASTSLYTDVQM